MVNYYIDYDHKQVVHNLDDARKKAIGIALKGYRKTGKRTLADVCKYEHGYLYSIGIVGVSSLDRYYWTPVTYPGDSDIGKRGFTYPLYASGKIKYN